MKWTVSASMEVFQKIQKACEKKDREFLILAINEAYAQLGMDLITPVASRYISDQNLQSLLFDTILDTDTCDEDEIHYWIDFQGKYKIEIPR